MDRITIKIEKDIDLPGGGTVVDNTSAVLSSLPDGSSLLELACAAFAAAYGIYEEATPTVEDPDAKTQVSKYRNISYQLRRFGQTITDNFVSKQIDAAAQLQKDAAKTAGDASLNIVEN